VGASGSAIAGSVEFDEVPVPTTDEEKRSVLASATVTVDGKTSEIGYHTIMRSGDQPGDSILPFGTLIDIAGQPVVDLDGHVRVSNDNDFSSLVQGKKSGLFMVSHFESRPAAMYLTKMKQHPTTGLLTPVKTRPLDFSHVNGGWVHCAGSVTPWGNHLGSEEYPPDAKQWRDETIGNYNGAMAQYFGVMPVDADNDGRVDDQAAVIAVMNPYDYGFSVEVEVKNYDKATVTKHYSMGRVAIELSYVMPNQKTVYTSDDGSRVGLFRYEADHAGDLSAGTLYAAKFTQTSPWYAKDTRVAEELRDGGAGDIDWIELGHATNDEIRDIIDSGVTFADIFDEDVPGCTHIINRDSGSSGECLLVKPGMEKAAAFLETSRYAGIVGATTEWEKMEGITLDPETNTMYLAMSRVRNAMTDDSGHMSVPFNYCGTVYGLDLDENYVAENIYGVVSGIPRIYSRGALLDNPYDPNGPYAANNCDLEGISEPDNVTFIPGYGTLIIGEDTGQHQNDMIWSYNLESEELTRIQTTPYGSETTSPYFYPNINRFGYMMSVIQHPFGESDQNALLVPEEARGYTGYMGPFPAMD
jgi:secreted PhoX family phosphatase